MSLFAGLAGAHAAGHVAEQYLRAPLAEAGQEGNGGEEVDARFGDVAQFQQVALHRAIEDEREGSSDEWAQEPELGERNGLAGALNSSRPGHGTTAERVPCHCQPRFALQLADTLDHWHLVRRAAAEDLLH